MITDANQVSGRLSINKGKAIYDPALMVHRSLSDSAKSKTNSSLAMEIAAAMK